MNSRLKLLRQQLNLTQEKLGEKIGLSGGHISDIEHGRKSLTERTAKALCYEFNVNEHWLKTGDGPIFHQSYDSIFDALETDNGFDALDKAIVNLYLTLPGETRKLIKQRLVELITSYEQIS